MTSWKQNCFVFKGIVQSKFSLRSYCFCNPTYVNTAFRLRLCLWTICTVLGSKMQPFFSAQFIFHKCNIKQQQQTKIMLTACRTAPWNKRGDCIGTNDSNVFISSKSAQRETWLQAPAGTQGSFCLFAQMCVYSHIWSLHCCWMPTCLHAAGPSALFAPPLMRTYATPSDQFLCSDDSTNHLQISQQHTLCIHVQYIFGMQIVIRPKIMWGVRREKKISVAFYCFVSYLF